MGSKILLEARQVTRRFPLPDGTGEYTVLHGVDVALRDGEVVALLGKSGSGKSTLLRILAGLIAPSAGTALYRGRPFAGACPGVAMVFQSFALLPWLDVQGNVELGLKARGLDPVARREKALRMIDLIGLDGFESAYPRELSGGMRQRVGIARALAVEPDVLLMDEPFSALDVLTAESLRGELMDLWVAGEIPIRAMLIVTHNIQEAVLLADRVLVLGANPGHVRAELPIALPRPRSREKAETEMLTDRVYQLMTRPETAEEARRVSVARPAIAPLPQARVGALTGLLELLNERGGREDLYRLAGDLQFEVDDLLPLIDAAALLGFARVEEADAVLTAAGAAFVSASIDGQKAIVRQALTARANLITRIHSALIAKKNHRLPEAFFLDLLEEHFSEKQARRQLDIAIGWGRYAELFGFEDDTDELFLEEGSEPIQPSDETPRASAAAPPRQERP